MINLYEASSIKINNPIIIDIGCNIGYESKKLFDIFNPKLLISVDPFEYNIEKTKELIGFNYERWIVDCCAIDNEDDEKLASLNISHCTNNSPCGFLLQEGEKYKDIVKVKTKKIETIHKTPDILKIDIEGYEFIIWEQLINIKSVKIIFLEIHGGTHYTNYEDKVRIIKELEKSFNTRYFTLNQSQNLNNDYSQELKSSPFNGCDGNYFNMLLERKK